MATTKRTNRTNRNQRRNGRNAKPDLMSAYLKTAIVVVAVVVVIALIWLIVKPFRLRAQKERLESSVSESELLEITVSPEYEDGSGEAGRAKIPDSMHIKYDTPGWQHDDNGWWYASDEKTFYVNGWFKSDAKEYHFDSTGYMDTGWTPIGGRGCFFDENGVYDASADSSHMIALTFDDGPGESTGDVLDTLEANGAKATFFMLGEMVEQYGSETIPRMVRLGCQLGNHSYDHSDMTTLTTSAALQQFQDTDAQIAKYSGGVPASIIRFPYGSFNDALESKIDKPSAYWDLDTEDWKGPEPAELTEYVLTHVEGGNIILMHDIHQNTVDAVKLMVPRLKEAGWQMVTLEELAAARGFELKTGVTYYGFTEMLIANNRVSDEGKTTEAADTADTSDGDTTDDESSDGNSDGSDESGDGSEASDDGSYDESGEDESGSDESGSEDSEESYDDSGSYDESGDGNDSYDESGDGFGDSDDGSYDES